MTCPAGMVGREVLEEAVVEVVLERFIATAEMARMEEMVLQEEMVHRVATLCSQVLKSNP